MARIAWRSEWVSIDDWQTQREVVRVIRVEHDEPGTQDGHPETHIQVTRGDRTVDFYLPSDVASGLGAFLTEITK